MSNEIDRSAAQAMPAAIATLDGVTRRYGQAVDVDGLSLAILRGQTVALLGPNGAGKTTTVELLLGLANPEQGMVHLFGGPPADAVADRLVVIAGGRLVADGTPEQVKARAAGRSTVSVAADDLPREALERLPGVQAVESDRGRLTLSTTDPDATIRALLQQAPRVQGLEVTRAGMEEAFLHLTRQGGTP